MSRLHFFGACDPQQSSAKRADDGCAMVAMARDKRDRRVPEDWDRPAQESDFDFGVVYIRVIRGFAPSEWSGFLHGLHANFGFDNLILDHGAGGAGPSVGKELGFTEQKIPVDLWRDPRKNIDLVRQSANRTVRPILSRAEYAVDGQFILTRFKRGDEGIDLLFNDGTRKWSSDSNLVDAGHSELKLAFERGMIGLLPSFEHWPRQTYYGWPQERIQILRQSGNLLAQLRTVGVEETEDSEGNRRHAFDRHGARVFCYSGRKDVAMTMMMLWTGFLVWLKWQQYGWRPDEDTEGNAALVG